ncbi:MAG: hypothetical protein KDD64_03835, partial [Bdellovibrionales bacterium]|nr:hypothetical protein [Bdellovibrionales bacterium]
MNYAQRLKALQSETNCCRKILVADDSPEPTSPFAAKDCFSLSGLESSWGVSPPAKQAGPKTAPLIEKLISEGGELVALTNLDPLCLSASGENKYHGAVLQPPSRAGKAALGSSSGSGVLAASGLVIGAFGTDLGGSVRLPAAANGVIGFKSSPNLFSREDVLL